MISRIALSSVALAVGVAVLPSAAARPSPPSVSVGGDAANPIPRDSCEATFGQTGFAGDRRVVTGHVGASRVRVLLPPKYRTSTRRYPVVYLLHGAQGSADSWLVYSDLLRFTAAQPDSRQAVVVMPDTTIASGMDLDWADGTHQWETYVARDLPRWVNSRFRVATSRQHTAIAGYSGGGYSALHLAEAHADDYRAVGAFSPVASLSFAGLAGESLLWAVFKSLAVCDGSDPAGPGILPDPVSHPAAWVAADPAAGAVRLRRTDVYIATGDGTPCAASDAQYAAYGVPLAEAAIARTVDDLDRALTASGVRHTTDRYGCGLHWWPWWQRDLHAWWPRMIAAIR